MGCPLEGKLVFYHKKHKKHTTMKRGSWKELLSKPQTIPSYGQNLYFNILSIWIKLLPSFEILASMK